MDQIQRHDVGATALQVHILIVYRGLMSTAIGILYHKLKLGQALRHAVMSIYVSNILLVWLLFCHSISLRISLRLVCRHE